MKYLIEKLQAGEAVEFRARGYSMMPIIKDGQSVRVEPASKYNVGDVVMCRVKGRDYLHLIHAIQGGGLNQRFQIGNNKGHINGWTGKDKIFGKVT